MAKLPVETNRELRTTAQACAQLGCSRATIAKLWESGKLERVRFGGQTRVTARSLNALVDALLAGETLYPNNNKNHHHQPKRGRR